MHLANHDVGVVGRVARTARQAAGLQASHGMDVSMGVLERLSTSTSTSSIAFTEDQQRDETIEYN